MEIDQVNSRIDSKSLLLDIYYLSLLLVVVTMPFSIQINTLTLTFSVICWFALMLNQHLRRQLLTSLKSNATAILFIAYSLATVISVIIHFGSYDEFNSVLKTIERRSVFLFLPLVLSGVIFLSVARIRRLLMLFSQIMIFSSLLCLAIGLVATLKSGTIVHINPLNNIVENNFMYHRLVSYLGLHAVFFSSQVCFVFCMLLIKFFNERGKLSLRKRIAYYSQLLFLVTMIVLLQSIAISIVFLLLTLLIVFHHLYYNNRTRNFIRLALLTVILVGLGSAIGISNKFKEGTKLLEYDLSEYPGPQWNAINLRLAIWDVNMKVIKDHWVLGVGPSNMNKVLGDYYEKYDFRFGILDKLNPHNQFLHTLLLLGLGGFLILIALIASIIIRAIKQKDLILGSLLIIFILFSLTASTLSVNKGIVFFTFFFTLLTYLNKSTISYLIPGSE